MRGENLSALPSSIGLGETKRIDWIDCILIIKPGIYSVVTLQLYEWFASFLH